MLRDLHGENTITGGLGFVSRLTLYYWGFCVKAVGGSVSEMKDKPKLLLSPDML